MNDASANVLTNGDFEAWPFYLAPREVPEMLIAAQAWLDRHFPERQPLPAPSIRPISAYASWWVKEECRKVLMDFYERHAPRREEGLPAKLYSMPVRVCEIGSQADEFFLVPAGITSQG